jgi:hypothetical protein
MPDGELASLRDSRRFAVGYVRWRVLATTATSDMRMTTAIAITISC